MRQQNNSQEQFRRGNAIVGDIHGTPGRSLYVKLSGRGAGYWTDAATAENGDLLTLLSLRKNLQNFRETLEEARQFLREPRPIPAPAAAANSPAAARRLFALSRPISGTLAEIYLRHRGITGCTGFPALRYHPGCYYRAHDAAPREVWPALIAAVTDPGGEVTGVQRTWLSRDGKGKAPLGDPRRAMGSLLGNAVRFGKADDVLAAGEGIETVLSLRSTLPALPLAAALTAAHLGAILFPATLRRLYIVRDNDAAGRHAEEMLRRRADEARIEPRLLLPCGKDFNIDLGALTPEVFKAHLAAQLAPEDVTRFCQFLRNTAAMPQRIDPAALDDMRSLKPHPVG